MELPLKLPSLPSGRSSPRTVRRVGALAALSLAVVLGALAYWHVAGSTFTARRAQVEGLVFTLPAVAAGTVAEMAVTEGQIVREGEPVFRLDDAPLRLALAQAEASLQSVLAGGTPRPAPAPADREAEAEALQEAERQRELENAARRYLEHWTAEHARAMVSLRSPAATAGSERDAAIASEAQARKAVTEARQAMEEAGRRRAEAERRWQRLRDAGPVPHSGPELEALWRTRVAEAERDLAGATALAPADARVIWVAAKAGQKVRRDEDLVALAPLPVKGGEEKLWVTAFFDRRHMLELRVGMACRVRVEDGPVLEGRLAALLPDDQEGLARISLSSDSLARLAEDNMFVYPGQSAAVEVTVR